jgi:hypothetical protein
VAAQADAWLAAAQPDIVLLNVGTNDTLQNVDLPNAPARLNALLDQIVAARPSATVLFSTLVPSPNATSNARVRDFNAQLPAIARGQAEAGHKVRLVDLNSTLTTADISPDEIHPTAGGYLKLAGLWYSGLRPVLGAGRPWPLFRQDFGAAAPPLTWTDTVEGSVNVGGYCCNLPGMESGRRAETAHGGTYALMFSGNDLSETRSYSYNRVFDVHIPIEDDTTLSGGRLVPLTWNLVQVRLSTLAGGTIDQIRVGYDQPRSTGPFRGYLDDITVISG